MLPAEKIKLLIAEELRSEQDINNVFGLDLNKCLIEPIKQTYRDASDDSMCDLWTVLEETADNDGYKIYYDEGSRMYGLGFKSAENELINIGYYGTFLKTLQSM